MNATQVELPVLDMMFKLALTVLLPLAVGKGIRENPWRGDKVPHRASHASVGFHTSTHPKFAPISWRTQSCHGQARKRFSDSEHVLLCAQMS
jgi:hypothetical protein